jgi:DNA-binding NarL/FixJ family response regulator
VNLGHNGKYPNLAALVCDADGTFIPTDTEAALARAAAEHAATAAAQRQIAQGVVNLLQMGLTTAQVAQALGLSEPDVQRIATEQQNP